MATEGILPGGLKCAAAPSGWPSGSARESEGKVGDPLAPLDWVTVYAMAVNEENAAGGRVVTAPTNGAAGVIPAVAHYYHNSSPTRPERRGHPALLPHLGRHRHPV